MNPALVITIIETAIRLAPSVAGELRLLLAAGDPTPQDWDALRAKVQKSYDEYIAEAKQPPPS